METRNIILKLLVTNENTVIAIRVLAPFKKIRVIFRAN